jgi:hypothetical protein
MVIDVERYDKRHNMSGSAGLICGVKSQLVALRRSFFPRHRATG